MTREAHGTVSIAPPRAAAPNEQRFARLEATLAGAWQQLLSQSAFVRRIYAGDFDARLYGIYMIETFHYTSHNARNQALAGARTFDRSPQYLKFCFEHAEEETGHELMAFHDLCSLGLDGKKLVLPPALPATEVLIAYLYWVSQHGNSVRRLGYSFWAEDCYDQITPLLDRVRERLNLQDHQLTFFVAHSRIDDAHAREVRAAIGQHCDSNADWDAVEQVMATSLRLTGQMLEEVEREYAALVAGMESRYSFLNSLV